MASPLALTLGMQQPVAPTKGTAVAPTDVVGAYKMATDAANTQYLAKLQQQNALWGGLAGLGSAGILVAPKAIPAISGLFGSTPMSPAVSSMLGPMQASGGLLGDLSASDFGAAAPAVADASGAGLGSLGAAGRSMPAWLGSVTGAAAPTVAADLGTGAAATGAGTVATDLAAAAAPAVADAAGAAAADAGAFSLADLLPFIFAA